MDLLKDALRRVGEVVHQQLDALSIDIVCAGDIVLLFDVWHAIRQALSVQVFLGIVRLMLDQVVWCKDIVETSLFDVGSLLVDLLVGLIQADLVVCICHSFRSIVKLLQFCLIKCSLHFINKLLKK